MPVQGGAKSSQERFRDALAVYDTHFPALYHENVVGQWRAHQAMTAYRCAHMLHPNNAVSPGLKGGGDAFLALVQARPP